MPHIHRTIDELGEMAGSPSDIGAETVPYEPC